jgi:hypothetical protein
MISLPHPVRVFLHTPATDLRKGFDALSGLVTTAFAQNPTSGHLFLFVNRRRDRIRRSGDLVQTPRNRLVPAPSRQPRYRGSKDMHRGSKEGSKDMHSAAMN